MTYVVLATNSTYVTVLSWATLSLDFNQRLVSHLDLSSALGRMLTHQNFPIMLVAASGLEPLASAFSEQRSTI